MYGFLKSHSTGLHKRFLWKLSCHCIEGKGCFFVCIGSWLMGNKSRCLEQFLGWDHSISGKTWERSLTVNKDSDRRTLQYYIASLWHLGGNISRSIVLYSISFIISEISATGCCHSHWTKWPLTWQSCPSEPMWKHGLFLFVVYDQSYWISVILRYLPFHLRVLHGGFPVLPYCPVLCSRYRFLLLLIAGAVFSSFQQVLFIPKCRINI